MFTVNYGIGQFIGGKKVACQFCLVFFRIEKNIS